MAPDSSMNAMLTVKPNPVSDFTLPRTGTQPFQPDFQTRAWLFRDVSGFARPSAFMTASVSGIQYVCLSDSSAQLDSCFRGRPSQDSMAP